ncbi:MAG: SAM-dependent chlorinase/fluorinase [Bacteroidia bacterium]|nr:SAM-dependent chlorinase/fluorinase [Bacteroidia bacterium]
MSIVTFTTDWGTRDYHIGALKGMLLSMIPDVRFIDLSHQVARHNIQQAAYIFKNAFPHFPAGSLHFIGVHGQIKQSNELLAIKKENHIFIGLNDGFFSLIFEDSPIDVVKIQPVKDSSFLYDLPTLAGSMHHLLSGKNLYELGSRPEHVVQRSAFQPAIDEELIHGLVIYIDDFGNVVTNITNTLFETQRKGRKFEVVVRKTQHTIDSISESYHSVDPGSALAFFNAAGYLEIAINEDNAYKLMNLRLNDNIRIEFK